MRPMILKRSAGTAMGRKQFFRRGSKKAARPQAEKHAGAFFRSPGQPMLIY